MKLNELLMRAFEAYRAAKGDYAEGRPGRGSLWRNLISVDANFFAGRGRIAH
jgi:hypothetical protein